MKSMKRMILGAALIGCLGFGTARAQLGNAWIGLYGDANRERPCWCPIAAGMIARFDLWVWCKPPVDAGLRAMEFSVSYPFNVIPANTAYHPAVSLVLGELHRPEGIAVAFETCQTSWLWIARQEVWVVSQEKTVFELGPYWDSGLIDYVTCEPESPLYPAFVIAPRLLVNEPAEPCCMCYCCACAPANETIIAVEHMTWGGIKSLFHR